METTKKCPYCGNEFQGRSNKIYCSQQCKLSAFYKNKFNAALPNPYTSGKTVAKPVDPEEQESDANLIPSENASDTEIPEAPNRLYNANPENGTIQLTLRLTDEEREYFSAIAEECGVGIEKVIKVRAMMKQTDIVEMERRLSTQQAVIDDLLVKLSFFGQQAFDEGKHPEKEKPFGVFIEMSPAQKQFMIQKMMESEDVDNSVCYEYEGDRRIECSWSEYMNKQEAIHPGSIESYLISSLIISFFEDIQERLIEECGYDEDAFEDVDLHSRYVALKNSRG